MTIFWVGVVGCVPPPLLSGRKNPDKVIVGLLENDCVFTSVTEVVKKRDKK